MTGEHMSLVVCSDCANYVPGDYRGGGHADPAKCKARNNKNLPPAWVYKKRHKCPANAFQQRECISGVAQRF